MRNEPSSSGLDPVARRHDLDALRAFAMGLGIVLHAGLSFFHPVWAIRDSQQSPLLHLLCVAIHGFRMPLFFLLSGYFTMMLYRQRGLAALLRNRTRRILVPFVLALLTIVPAARMVWSHAALHSAAATIETTTRLGTAGEATDAVRDFLRSNRFRVEIAGRSIHLFDTPVFDHLWFLAVLLWLVAAFALIVLAARRFGWRRPRSLPILPATRLLWLLPLTFAPQTLMARAPVAFGGAPAPGLLPPPHVLFYYAVFFFFGTMYYDAHDARNELGRRWPALLACGLLLLFPLGLATLDRPPLAAALHALYAWCMTFGLIGLFRGALRRAHPAIRYISDASYWMYLAHPPLVLALQFAVRDWPLPALAKLALIAGAATLILLAAYRAFVRHTWIGALLNGPRSKARNFQTLEA